ncbi:hypothetical protein V8C43DRAFT_227024 [Trichoderma afarasin]
MVRCQSRQTTPDSRRNNPKGTWPWGLYQAHIVRNSQTISRPWHHNFEWNVPGTTSQLTARFNSGSSNIWRLR